MRIVDAEPKLIVEILDELEIVSSKNKPSFKVYVGRHQTLGKMVVIDAKEGGGAIVELE